MKSYLFPWTLLYFLKGKWSLIILVYILSSPPHSEWLWSFPSFISSRSPDADHSSNSKFQNAHI